MPLFTTSFNEGQFWSRTEIPVTNKVIGSMQTVLIRPWAYKNNYVGVTDTPGLTKTTILEPLTLLSL